MRLLVSNAWLPLTVLLLVGTSACSSLRDLQRMAMGNPVEVDGDSRSPASSNKRGSVVIMDKKFEGDLNDVPVGADLGRNEFGIQSSTQGKSDPWYGTGPENEGSLWNGASQDNFYFTVNTSYKVGDIIYVEIDSDVNDSLNAKIAALLGEKGKSTRKIVAEEAGREVASEVANKIGGVIGNDRIGEAVGRDAGEKVESSLDLQQMYVNLDRIPMRIVEAVDERIFRIEGDRKIFIRNAPYKVAMTGRIRHEDLTPDGTIESTRVLESKLELTK